MGEATTRFVDRTLAAVGAGTHATPIFEESKALCGAGILFLLPFLLAQGLLKAKEVFRLPATHYYGLESVVLTLAFMALARIKNPEQLKQCKPGEIGRIIGLDRVPEVRCLREKIKTISEQGRSIHFNNILIDQWYSDDQQGDAGFLYVDGHVRIYYGYKANLPSKYIARQKLCLSATSEFWVNDARGMPVLMVMGELTEKLQTVIEQQIIPRLIETKLISAEIGDQEDPQCTLVFDREAYSPAFFQRLWESYRIAVITYRKNVKDYWDENGFERIDVQVLDHIINMDLCEQETELGGYRFREIRRLGVSGHQTAIITTHPHLETWQVAGRMFARWSQENFFRYLIKDYDFDKMISFGVETIDMEKTVVNPQYRKATYQIKKLKEKIQRIESKFYPLVEQTMDNKLEKMPQITDKQMQYKLLLDQYRQEADILVKEREKLQPRIKLGQMPEEKRYNKLKKESKIFMNVIKMICYRAETAVASIISPYLANAEKEKRMVVKQIIQANADVVPDYKNKTLQVILYSLSANRYNRAAAELAGLLNQTETTFPGTDLRMVFKISANLDCDR